MDTHANLSLGGVGGGNIHPNSENCLIRKRNDTFFLTHVYEAIPQTLLLNFCVWLIIILIFSVIRRHAWNYGRLGLMNRNKCKRQKWMELFYLREDSYKATCENNDGDSGTRNIRQSVLGLISKDSGFFNWIIITCKLKDDQILKNCGPDAIHYLSFQRHLMIVMAVITVISIGILLPVNYHGELIPDANAFGRTTVSNLKPESPLLWIHVVTAICYIPLVVLVMRLASGRNAAKRAGSRTIMARNVSVSQCNKDEIGIYLHQLFPNCEITDIQLAFAVRKLIEISERFDRVHEARRYCQRKPVEMSEARCSRRKMDALEYYEHKEMQLQRRVDELREEALRKPLGIAFISMSTVSSAHNLIKSFKAGTFYNWHLSFAPLPSDIFWENLQSDTSLWFLKWLTVNMLLFLVLFFLTTPIIVVNLLATFGIYKSATQQVSTVSPFISEFLPTLMLWTLAAGMPAIVTYSEKLLSHSTRSKLNYTIMTKSFGYLLFMILILPSLGLTSAQAFLEWTLYYNDRQRYRWECIFLPGKGAFFVNYVVTAAFIGTAFELIRLPELIDYVWQLGVAKTRAETAYIRKTLLNEFPFGVQYAWTLLIFTISTVYSIACPLIMPFAMIYMGLKHFVDRHNLFFAYGPSYMVTQGRRIHFTAITMTKVAVIILLIIMAALTTARGGGLDARGIVLIVALNVTLAFFMFMSYIKKWATKPAEIIEPLGRTPIYIPDVLRNRASVAMTESETDEIPLIDPAVVTTTQHQNGTNGTTTILHVETH